jgi:hypothetical protein
MPTRGGPADDRFYDRLDPDKVSDTLDQLQHRILEQFPHRHLAQVATEVGEVIRRQKISLLHLAQQGPSAAPLT